MNMTQLIAEYLIIGSLLLWGVAIVFRVPIDQSLMPLTELGLLLVILIGAVAYVIGFFINSLAEAVYRPLYRVIETRWMTREGNPSLALDHIRYDVYVTSSSEVIQRLEYHRSLLRVSRSVGLIALILLAAALVRGQLIEAGVLSTVILISVFSYQRRVIWFTKSVYFSWLAQQRKENVHPTNTDDTIQIERREVMDSYEAPRVIVFAGGTGFREINIELAHYTRHISRIVSIWDNGGSSKILRQHFPVIPIGDVRHVLMTMAHGEGRLDPVVRLFNWRLPDAGSANELRHELSRFANGTHPLIAPIEPSLKDVIVTYLQCFEAELPDNIDLSRGSIGNFVLLGAYLTHGQNMNTAIYVFRQLCSIRGNVWPVSLQSGVHIGAHLEDGQTIIGQELVTNIDRNKHRAKIKKIFFTQGLIQQEHSNSPLLVKANHLVLEALKKSNVVVFGPGSFFTSVIPHLMVEGVVDTIASLDIPKVLVSNMLECNETYNYTLEELVEVFFNVVDQFATTKRAAHAYLTHIFVNDSSGLVFLPGTDRHYLPLGNNLERFAQDGIILVAHNFEDPWHRGYHNPQYTAHLITELGKSRSIIL